MALTDFLAQRILNALLQIGSNDFGGFTTPPSLFLAASTTTPADDGTGFTEPSEIGTNYARVEVEPGGLTAFGTAAAFGAGTNTISNDALIQFNQATSAWGDITHVAIFDASTVGGGNLLFHAQLSGGAVTIDANDRLAFQIGDLQFSLT